MRAQRKGARHIAHAPRSWSQAEVRALIEDLLDAAGLDRDERVELLGGAFVTEAVRPYWLSGCSAEEAHRELQLDDPELSEAVEAISPMLLGRARAREDARLAIRHLEELIRDNS